ncbi:hypothetical protein ACVWWR_005413 [Bradyrhizobium sp. LM3.2]
MSSEFVSCDAGDSEHHACLVILPGYSEKRDSGAGKKEGSPGSSIICFQVEVVTPNRTQPDWLVLSPKAGPQFWFAVKPRELTSSWRRRDQPGGMAHQRRHGRRGHTGVRADRPSRHGSAAARCSMPATTRSRSWPKRREPARVAPRAIVRRLATGRTARRPDPAAAGRPAAGSTRPWLFRLGGRR